MDRGVFTAVVLVLSSALLSQASGSTRQGGAYFVSNVESLVVGESVDYEMRSASSFASHLFSSFTRPTSPLPDAMLIIVSTTAPADPVSISVSVSDTASGVSAVMPAINTARSAGLKNVLRLAASSTYFTSVGESCETLSVKDALLAGARGVATHVRLGGSCSRGETQESLQEFLESWESHRTGHPGMALLVFCQSLSPSSPSSDSPSDMFYKAFLHLQNTTSKFTALLIPETPHSSRATCSRTLVEEYPPPTVINTCDETCKTKASLWEALLVTVVLVTALVSGLCCLVDLDSPTRFETSGELSS